VDDAMLSHNGASGAESKTMLCFVEFAIWRHPGKIRCLWLPCWYSEYCKHLLFCVHQIFAIFAVWLESRN